MIRSTLTTSTGGPSPASSLNMQHGKYRKGLAKLIRTDAGAQAFEQNIAPITTIEPEWYGYVLKLKQWVADTATPPVIFNKPKRHHKQTGK